MRDAAEHETWEKLVKAKVPDGLSLPVSFPVDAQVLQIDKRCVVLAGLNGSGKTRTLDRVADTLGDTAVLVRVHELCERTRSILRSRDDIEEMEAELGALSIDAALQKSLSRIVGRDYDEIEWYALELDSDSGDFEDWPFVQDGQPLVPHFRLSSDGISYSSLDMGLGELSVHLALWALWQHRDRKGLTVLLDEPDAYLPPRSQLRLLARLLETALNWQWNLVITSHSEGVIEEAMHKEALVRLVRNSAGIRFAYSSVEGSRVAEDLIVSGEVKSILFVEDESGAALTRAMLRRYEPEVLAKTAVIWKDGDGYLRRLSEHLPRNSAMPISFALVYDGDLRGRRQQEDVAESRRWSSLYLPTATAPDGLFRSLKTQVPLLAARVNEDVARMEVLLDGLQGEDDHDWVNKLCGKLKVGRPAALLALSDLWVEANPAPATAFVRELCDALGLPCSVPEAADQGDGAVRDRAAAGEPAVGEPVAGEPGPEPGQVPRSGVRLIFRVDGLFRRLAGWACRRSAG